MAQVSTSYILARPFWSRIGARNSQCFGDASTVHRESEDIVSTIDQAFQPPLYWQQFENLTEGTCRIRFQCPTTAKNGRVGQPQCGVDVFGIDGHSGKSFGVQCKQMGERDENNHPYPGGALSLKIVKDEAEKATKFQPQLQVWIIATTAKRELIATAFRRAAFATPLHLESPAEFEIALADTNTAITTGELKDRETRRVIQRTIGGYGKVTNVEVRKLLREAKNEVSALRILFKQGLADGRMVRAGAVLTFGDGLREQLETHRNKSIGLVNQSLKIMGMPPL